MIVMDCEQGSPEWVAARIGIPTSSNFNQIVTASKVQLSKSSEGYRCQLLAEWMLDAALDDYVSEWMERGQELEDQAFAYYNFNRDADAKRVGFIKRDDEWVGCSPDALVGDDGGLEIKCPTPKNHVLNMLEMTSKYTAQVQGTLWITGRKWWDLLSFHPELPPALVRIERDEEYIGKLETAVNAFATQLHYSQCMLIEAGHVDESKKRTMPGLVAS